MSLNFKILALAVVAAGSTITAVPQTVAAQGNSGKAEARAQKNDRKNDKSRAAKASRASSVKTNVRFTCMSPMSRAASRAS